MPKYFVEAVQGESVLLEGEVAHHLQRVLRVRIGDLIILCDGAKMDYHCTVKSHKPLILRIVSRVTCKTELPCKITLYQGIPKADKLEWIIQKSVELGVHSIVPVITEHAQKRSAKLERWQKISQSAAEQSMRGIIPRVHNPVAFAEAVSKTKAGVFMLAAHEKVKEDAGLRALDLPNCDMGLWIGPEGGFSENEAGLMRAAGFHLFSLGPRILRTETAAISAFAQIIGTLEADQR